MIPALIMLIGTEGQCPSNTLMINVLAIISIEDSIQILLISLCAKINKYLNRPWRHGMLGRKKEELNSQFFLES
jgi:hypothetical protein